ncbi:hypothetical protein [Halorarius halobius]|nr:hypothetical protein [Halorarius halobius]
MFTLTGKAVALATLGALVGAVLLFNIWLGVLALFAAVPFAYRVVAA